jgi:hypothetical protein
MANPVPPLEPGPELGVSRSAGSAPLPSNNFSADTLPPSPLRPRIVQAHSPALNGAAERLGSALGSAVERVKELPRRLEEMKQRFTVIRGRTREDAAAAAAEWNQTARQKLRVARNRAQLLADEHPVEVVLGAAGLAFVVGFMLRIWRSGHARR